ncbi:MAG TPA: glycosyltransferase family 4 protein [Candidatus Kapabacteria bacterium]|nr:glycosyltransferase family 4 protein [Candidatus Kapabacteria bacterium]
MKLIYPAIANDHTNPITNKELISNYLLDNFTKCGVEIEIATAPKSITTYILFIYKKICKYLSHKNYLLERSISILKKSSKYVSKQIAQSDADFVFAFGTIPVAFLETDKPIYIITDATFHIMHNYYSYYSNLCDQSYKNADLIEKYGLLRAKKIFLSSKWAIDDAINYYNVPESKIVHSYLGANIPQPPKFEEVEQFINTRNDGILNLILIGKDWYRKGIDRAIAINNEILNRGYKSNLIIIGSKAPKYISNNNVKIIENLNKSIPQESEKFNELLSKSHFMLFPTRADTFGHVVCEASAYGVPTIASQTGGVGDAVKDGVNGFLIDFNASGSIQKSADIIEYYFNNRNEYYQLCLSSFKRYQEELNWDVIVSKILKVIKEDLGTISKMGTTS